MGSIGKPLTCIKEVQPIYYEYSEVNTVTVSNKRLYITVQARVSLRANMPRHVISVAHNLRGQRNNGWGLMPLAVDMHKYKGEKIRYPTMSLHCTHRLLQRGAEA